MSAQEQYNRAFMETFQIDESVLLGLKYQAISTWDSIGHMRLIVALEEAFSIEMDIDDIIEFSSYEVGKGILAKYNVEIA